MTTLKIININQKKNLLFLSRIHPLKGLERLFIIFSKINKKFKMEWNLIIAGSGEKHI